MKDAIKACMVNISAEDGNARAEFVFPKSFVGFQGHFPDQPVLPGVCLVQAALVVAEELLSSRLRLQSIVSAKFFTSVVPDTKIQVQCSLANGVVKASIGADNERISELKLRLSEA